MSIPTLSASSSVTAVVEAMDEYGCAIVENLADPFSVKRFRDEVDPLLDAAPNGLGHFVGKQTKRISGLIKKTPASRPFALNPTALGVMDGVLGRHCERVQLHITQAISVGAGSTDQPLHRDRDMFGYLPHTIEPLINAIWAITPFRRENGGTVVAVGSHKWTADRVPQEADLSNAHMEPGSCLFFLGSTLHGAGANVTRERRIGLCLGYTLGWLRQFENQYLHVPPEVARTLEPALASLVGYAAHRPQLGLFEARDPMDFLYDGLPENQAPDDIVDAASAALLRDYIAQREELRNAS